MHSRTLLIGYGNAGRCDDGLGPAFAQEIADAKLPNLDIDIDYQLTVDHALAVTTVDRVVFADALMQGGDPYCFSQISGGEQVNLGSHSLTPSGVLTLARSLYGIEPEAFVIAIAGYEFGRIEEGLSAGARSNLEAATAFFLDWYASANNA